MVCHRKVPNVKRRIQHPHPLHWSRGSWQTAIIPFSSLSRTCAIGQTDACIFHYHVDSLYRRCCMYSNAYEIIGLYWIELLNPQKMH